MRKLALAAVGLPLVCAAYAVWPMASALQIKHAITTGDVITLERLVHWEPVRASLKASLADMPAMQIAGDERRLAHGQAMPSIWARVKAAAAPVMLARLIDTYVTADGVTRLHQVRRGAFSSALGLAPQPQPREGQSSFSGRRSFSPTAEPATLDIGDRSKGTDGPSITSRVLDFCDRLVSVRFLSLSLAEFEIADTANTGRRIVSQFVLTHFEWKLISVRIIGGSL